MFIEGQEVGFNFFYRQWFSGHYFQALRMVKEDIAATSIAQEAYLRLWQRRDSIRDLKHLSDFLGQQIRQAAWDYHIKPSTKFYRSLLQLDGMEYGAEYWLPDRSTFGYIDDSNAEDRVADPERVEQRQQLYAVIPDLPEHHRRIIGLLLQFDLDYERIAWHLGGISSYVAARQIEKVIALLKSILVSGLKSNGGNILKKQVVMVDGLTEQQAAVLRYRYELCYSFEEIATLLNIRQADVQRSFVQAHQKMRKEQVA